MLTLSRPHSMSPHPSARFWFIIALLLLVLTCGLAGCGSGSSTPPPKILQALQVSPGNSSIVLGTNQQFTATGTFTDGSTQDLTASAAWSSSNTAVATISGSGLATSLTIGRVQVAATSGSIRGSTTLITVISETAGVPRFAYVADNVDGTISAYTVSPTGQLRNNGYAFAGKLPQAVVVDPGNKFAYVVNSGVGVEKVSVEDTLSLAVEPSGRFAYVTNGFNNNVAAYSIDPTAGTLNQISGSPFSTGAIPSSVAADVSGKFLYVASQSDGASAYTVDSGGGALTPVVGSPWPETLQFR